MMKKNKVVTLSLATSLMVSLISGCGKSEPETMETEKVVQTEIQTEINTEMTEENETEQNTETQVLSEIETEVVMVETETEERMTEVGGELTSTQKDSVGMLNYLTVLTKEINDSSNSRLYIEEAYASLLNNTYPNAVDSRTLVEMTDLLDILEEYRMIDVKRERLDYIYEHNQAQAIRSAIPSPLALLSLTNAVNGEGEVDIAKLVGSLAYMAIDSITSYTAYTETADLEYLQDGWDLDDQEDTTLHNSRSATFTYMMDMVREYDIPGDLTLYENAVNDFVMWKNNQNDIQRIQFLESNEATYAAFGPYWLTLAQSYFNVGDYTKCLDAINSYETLDTRLFRKDYDLAKTLPLAIVAASECLDENDYVEKADYYAELILNNCDQDDWELRYLVAQTYVDLCAKTGDEGYLQKAYDIALNSVNILVSEQQLLNDSYLSDVKLQEIPKDATKEKKEEIENYNKQLEQERKTALPPIYEPLSLNCELLFALADELDISDTEKSKIDGILHSKNANIFLVNVIDNKFRFGEPVEEIAIKDIDVEYDDDTFIIPAQYITDGVAVEVTLITNGEELLVTDWQISEVERKDGNNLAGFSAKFESETADDYKYTDDTTVKVKVMPNKDCKDIVLMFDFATEMSGGVPDFWNSYASFNRIEE